MKKTATVIGGLLLGPAFGIVAAIPFALVIDAAYGHEVTGGQWHLTLPNIIYSGIIGLLTGLAAGMIVGRKGWLIGALAQFVPLTLVIFVSIVRNRDVFSMAEVPPATWTWIGLLPAVVGGYLGERVTSHGIGRDLLWFLPVCVGVTLYFEVANITSAYHNLALVYRRWSWALFFSPAAATFFGATLTSMWLPIYILLISFTLFDRTGPSYRRRYWWSAAVVVGIAASSALVQLIIWGSFPLPADSDGHVHLRMIPFFPWPTTSQ